MGEKCLLTSLMPLIISHCKVLISYRVEGGTGIWVEHSSCVLQYASSSQCTTRTLSRLWIACIYIAALGKDLILLFFLSEKPFLMSGQGCPKSNAISSGNFKGLDDYLQLTEDICAGVLTPYLIDYPGFTQPHSKPGPQLNRCHG